MRVPTLLTIRLGQITGVCRQRKEVGVGCAVRLLHCALS